MYLWKTNPHGCLKVSVVDKNTEDIRFMIKSRPVSVRTIQATPGTGMKAINTILHEQSYGNFTCVGYTHNLIRCLQQLAKIVLKVKFVCKITMENILRC